MSKVRTVLAGAALAGAAVMAAPVAAQAVEAAPPGFQPVSAAAWQGTCAKGEVCVWSGKNGTGTKCSWYGDDPDWQGGGVQCRPHGFKVGSIWNNGYTGGYDKVRFFRDANYGRQISDPVPVTKQGINAGDIAIRSHHWST